MWNEYFIALRFVSLQPTKCANQIEEVCQEIKKVIDQTIQTALNNLEKDCDYFRNKVQTRLRLDTEAKARNWKKNVRSKCSTNLNDHLILIKYKVLIKEAVCWWFD